MERFSYGALYHYGTPKMQWGVRRYQYEDGSLTPEGRIHYGVGERYRNRRPALSRLAEQTPEGLRRANQKRVSEMSEEEMGEKMRRLEMEKDLLSKEIEYQKKLGERAVPKYLTYLKDIKDVTSIVSSIASDVGTITKVAKYVINDENDEKKKDKK